jgi:predicted metal-dependent hydrolase
LSFNTEVLAQPAAFREYVIVHEFAALEGPESRKAFQKPAASIFAEQENVSVILRDLL